MVKGIIGKGNRLVGVSREKGLTRNEELWKRAPVDTDMEGSG